MTLRVFTAFSGYDAQCLALERIKRAHPGFDYDLVGWSEIDKYAIQAHNALFPQWVGRNYGDITKIDWDSVPDFDLFTYSSPCQDWSAAGKQAGGEEGSGTRSSLLWHCRKAIVAKHPKYLILENVAALVSKKFRPYFDKWLEELDTYGYDSYWKILNTKDFNVPQNRPRVFCVSVLRYQFPEAPGLHVQLKDVTEPHVAEKYYMQDGKVEELLKHVDLSAFEDETD